MNNDHDFRVQQNRIKHAVDSHDGHIDTQRLVNNAHMLTEEDLLVIVTDLTRAMRVLTRTVDYLNATLKEMEAHNLGK